MTTERCRAELTSAGLCQRQQGHDGEHSLAGEPRVISGLDAVAATPEPANGVTVRPYEWCGRSFDPKLNLAATLCSVTRGVEQRDAAADLAAAPPPPTRPSRVEVGQRRKCYGHEYVIVDGPDARGRWGIKWSSGTSGRWIECDLADDEYLGTVPAPVSAPGQGGELICGWTWHNETQDEVKCALAIGHAGLHAKANVAAAPGQSTPVETPPGRNCEACGPGVVYDEDGCCVQCGRDTAVGGAPAPGVGEDPRELTFAEAMRLLAQGQPVECWARSRNEWEPVPPLTGTTLLNVAKVWATQRYRCRPEPLPAPAPRVSRVREMVDEHFPAAHWGPQIATLCERIVSETLKAVRATYNPLEDVAKTLDRARAAMLEPRP